MLKKLIDYQRLLFSSTPSPNNNKAISAEFIFLIVASVMTLNLFDNNLFTTYIGLAIWMVVFSIWTINKNVNGDQRLFEMVPVSRPFTVFNIYLATVSIVTISFIAISLFGAAIALIFAGFLYINSPQSFLTEIVRADQLTVQGNVFMSFLLVIILFVGTTITFIRSGRYRNGAYVAFFLIGYGLLSALKSVMPPSPTGSVVFLESLSIMPEVNQLLQGVGIATLFIVPLSVFVGYKLYLARP